MRLWSGVTLVTASAALAGCNSDGISDLGPPSVVIVEPVVAVVVGTVDFSADAVDDIAVTRVVFSVGEQVIAEDTAFPWATRWDSKTSADGSVTLKVRAYDAVGNSGTDTKVVTVNNTPQ